MRKLRTLALLVVSASAQTAPAPPEQPVPFSHKTHADAGMECKGCHPNSDPGDAMGFPHSSACMTCHKTGQHESPALNKLAGLARKDREIKWVRVYQLPGFVRFSHRLHITAGFDCEECHGPVATRTVLARERDISQVGCLVCHRVAKAGVSCSTCHDG